MLAMTLQEMMYDHSWHVRQRQQWRFPLSVWPWHKFVLPMQLEIVAPTRLRSQIIYSRREKGPFPLRAEEITVVEIVHGP